MINTFVPVGSTINTIRLPQEFSERIEPDDRVELINVHTLQPMGLSRVMAVKHCKVRDLTDDDVANSAQMKGYASVLEKEKSLSKPYIKLPRTVRICKALTRYYEQPVRPDTYVVVITLKAITPTFPHNHPQGLMERLHDRFDKWWLNRNGYSLTKHAEALENNE